MSNPIAAVTGGVGGALLGGISGRANRKARNAAEARENMLNDQRMSLMRQGMEMGRERAQQLTGMDASQVGSDVQDIYATRKENANKPSRAADAIRSQGQNVQRRIASAGGSDAQRRQAMLDTAQRAGIQEDVDSERRLQQQQDLLASMLRTHSSLEPAYGQLQMSTQHIAPERRDPGFVGGLVKSLGLGLV